MGNKKIIFLFLYAGVIFFSGLLYAQESSPESQPGFFVDNSTGEPVFKQRLVWDKDEYALYYEVSIQIFSGRYSEYHTEITRNNFIEISLTPGRYRYSVTPYDLLERRCDSSDWEEFSVTTAFQPEIFKITPEFFYMDQNKNRVLIISGNNIFDDSVIYLRNEENDLVPIEKVVTNNSSVRLTFNDDTLIPGTYELYIKNPGGLDTFLSDFFVGYNNKLEAYFKIAYNPVIPIIGELEDIFGSYLYYSGATFRLEALTSKRSPFKVGLEFALSFYNLNNEYAIIPESSEDSLNFLKGNASISLIDFSLNITMQGRFNHLRNAVALYLGFGFTSLKSSGYGFSEDDGYYDLQDYDYTMQKGHMNLGLSGLFLIYQNFYIETGVESTYYLIGSSILIKPRIGFVLRV